MIGKCDTNLGQKPRKHFLRNRRNNGNIKNMPRKQIVKEQAVTYIVHAWSVDTILASNSQ